MVGSFGSTTMMRQNCEVCTVSMAMNLVTGVVMVPPTDDHHFCMVMIPIFADNP